MVIMVVALHSSRISAMKWAGLGRNIWLGHHPVLMVAACGPVNEYCISSCTGDSASPSGQL